MEGRVVATGKDCRQAADPTEKPRLPYVTDQAARIRDHYDRRNGHDNVEAVVGPINSTASGQKCAVYQAGDAMSARQSEGRKGKGRVAPGADKATRAGGKMRNARRM